MIDDFARGIFGNGGQPVSQIRQWVQSIDDLSLYEVVCLSEEWARTGTLQNNSIVRKGLHESIGIAEDAPNLLMYYVQIFHEAWREQALRWRAQGADDRLKVEALTASYHELKEQVK